MCKLVISRATLDQLQTAAGNALQHTVSLCVQKCMLHMWYQLSGQKFDAFVWVHAGTRDAHEVLPKCSQVHLQIFCRW